MRSMLSYLLFRSITSSFCLRHSVTVNGHGKRGRMMQSASSSSKIIADQKLDQQVEEYYEIVEVDDEPGVEVSMVAKQESYLRKDLQKRSLSSLMVNELVYVLRDQRAKNIIVIKNELAGPNPFIVICTPYNSRHGKALETVLRVFLKRNFNITMHSDVPKRTSGTPQWCILNIGSVTIHIMGEEIRRRYDLESLYLDLEEEENNIANPSWKIEYRMPEESLIKKPSQLGKNPARLST